MTILNDGNVGIGTSTPAHPLHIGNGAHCTSGGMWTNACDRDAKANFAAVDPCDVLERLADLPITMWRYKAEGDGVKHIGPTAQDFAAAFGLGNDDKSIGTVDADGVALAAIQGLHVLVREKDAQIDAQQVQISELTERMQALEKMVARLARERGE